MVAGRGSVGAVHRRERGLGSIVQDRVAQIMEYVEEIVLSLVFAWSIAIGKLLTVSEQRCGDCVTVDSACSVRSRTWALRSP